jgi:hypothetical protein
MMMAAGEEEEPSSSCGDEEEEDNEKKLTVAWMLHHFAVPHLLDAHKKVLLTMAPPSSLKSKKKEVMKPLQKLSQVEWAKVAKDMLKHRMKQIEGDISTEQSSAKRSLLRTEHKNWDEILPLVRLMGRWKEGYEEEHGIKKPFEKPMCIRAFNKRMSIVLGKSDSAKFKVKSLSSLMNKRNRKRFVRSRIQKRKKDALLKMKKEKMKKKKASSSSGGASSGSACEEEEEEEEMDEDEEDEDEEEDDDE